MINKYLKDLGVTEKNWPFSRDFKDKRYIPDDTGLAESDTWDMKISLAMIIYTYLMKFKETDRIAYPARLTPKEWEDVLDEMIKGFAIIIKGVESKTQFKKAKRALALFKTYYFDLGW